MPEKSVFKNPAAKGKEPKWVGEIPPAPVSQVPYNQDGGRRPNRGRSDAQLLEDDLDDLFETVDDER